jgi:hypothetical protein
VPSKLASAPLPASILLLRGRAGDGGTEREKERIRQNHSILKFILVINLKNQLKEERKEISQLNLKLSLADMVNVMRYYWNCTESVLPLSDVWAPVRGWLRMPAKEKGAPEPELYPLEPELYPLEPELYPLEPEENPPVLPGLYPEP